MQRFALVMAAALLGACSAQEAAVPLDSEPLHGGALTSGDRAALHALDTAYVKAWLDPDGATRSEALLSLCRERLAGYKLPKQVDVREAELPRTAAGKVLKRALREPFWQEEARRIHG